MFFKLARVLLPLCPPRPFTPHTRCCLTYFLLFKNCEQRFFLGELGLPLQLWESILVYESTHSQTVGRLQESGSEASFGPPTLSLALLGEKNMALFLTPIPHSCSSFYNYVLTWYFYTLWLFDLIFFITCWSGGKAAEVTLADDGETGPVLCKVCEGSSCLR